MFTLCEFYSGKNGTRGDGVLYCSRLGGVFWCPLVVKVVLGVAALDPPEAHVNEFEHLVHHGLVCDANGGGVVSLNGRGGLRPAHFHESFSKGYHGFGAD